VWLPTNAPNDIAETIRPCCIDDRSVHHHQEVEDEDDDEDDDEEEEEEEEEESSIDRTKLVTPISIPYNKPPSIGVVQTKSNPGTFSRSDSDGGADRDVDTAESSSSSHGDVDDVDSFVMKTFIVSSLEI